MSRYTEKAQALRDCCEKHYNCAQAVFMAFADQAGLDLDTADKIASNFGAGMKAGSVCGAVTGGLMVLGLFGITDTSDYYSRVKATIGEELNCAKLLQKNTEEKKAFCDGLISACVTVVEAMLKEAGKIQE
ncbi:MAG: C_GCAxxG_C_C family protein [Oscillospiraceae bacterium]|nr:C_GCAxxG_C_C family protein [Oscillospiraceae bacterium]